MNECKTPSMGFLGFFFAFIHLSSMHGSNTLLLDSQCATNRPGEHQTERKKDDETIEQTDIMHISKLARLPIHREGFLLHLGGVLNTIEKTWLRSHSGIYPINYEGSSFYRVISYRIHVI